MWFQAELYKLLYGSPSLPHALLIKGARGIGKQIFAQTVAQALLCEDRSAQASACGQCAACTWFLNGTHPDFKVISPITDEMVEASAESEGPKLKSSAWIVIDQIRQISDFIHVSGHRRGPRVVLIHPAETLNPNAANALLKNLEEPPPGVHFLLVTHRPHSLVSTILSRCQQLSLPLPNHQSAIQWLTEQGVSQSELALALSSGAPLLALSRHQEGAFNGRNELFAKISQADFDPVSTADSLSEQPLERFLAWMQQWTYDINSQILINKVRYNIDFKSKIESISNMVNRNSMLRLHRLLIREQRTVQHPLNTKLYIETVLMAYSAAISTKQVTDVY